MPKTPRIDIEDLVGSRGFGYVYRPTYTDRKTGEQKTSAIWWVEYSHEGKRHYVNSHSRNRADAETIRRAIFTELWQGRLPWVERSEPSLTDVLQLVRTHYTNKGNRSARRLELAITNVLRYPTFDGGRIRARKVTEAVVEQFVAWRKTWPKGNAPATINRELAVLRQGYRKATRRLDENGRPMLERAPHIELLKEPPPPQRYGSDQEFVALHAALRAGHPNTSPEDVADLALFYYLTGWRNSEPRSLQWEWVNWFARKLTLLDSKSGEPDEYPFGKDPDLEDLLRKRQRMADELKRDHGIETAWVFFRRVPGHMGDRISTFRRAWVAACKRVGIPTKGPRKLTPHCFRKTRTRQVMRALRDPFMTARLLRWKTIAMVKRYLVLDETDREEAVATVAQARVRQNAERERLPRVGGEGLGGGALPGPAAEGAVAPVDLPVDRIAGAAPGDLQAVHGGVDGLPAHPKRAGSL